MMEAAEQGRSAYRRIADRASSLYAPLVHLTALLTLIGWMFVEGDWHHAITIAVAVLIITCPCALGLAVPMVQVVAARRLFEAGIMIKDGGALERLAEVDTIVFDKTGTLTQGNPRLVDADRLDPAMLTLAGTIAAHSRHPFSRALASVAVVATPPLSFDAIAEVPGCGMEARMNGSVIRLGRPEWALDCVSGADINASSVVLSRDGKRLAYFRFEDSLRVGATDSVAELKRDGFAIEIVSGDCEAPVSALAASLGVSALANVLPGGKAEHVADLAKAGKTVLMVGDGLNDTPALMAAHASMAPASAADVGRNAADLVFLREDLEAVPFAIAVSREAQKLVRQNLALAVGYNFIAVPIAILGYVTPLVAAIAMSGSSIVVVANALRLRGSRASDTKSASSTKNSIAMRMESAE
jgi:P-type Cu2+ transporter